MPIPLEFALHDPDITMKKAIKAKQLDNERKPRFFDSKRRQIGVDVDALNLQVEENKLKKAAEKEENRKYEIMNNVLLREEHAMKDQEQWQRNFNIQQLHNFWKTNQRRELSREFDLNDPKYLLKSLPMCTDDNDPRIKSKGSLLRFEGEDYDGIKEKRKAGKLKELLEDQIREKQELRTSIKLADEEWINESLMENQFNNRFMELEEIVRKEEIRQVQAYNLILAKQKKNERIWEKKRSDSDDLSHVYNCLTSSFFLETGKGKSPELLREVKETQKLQIIEQEQMKEVEKARESYYLSLCTVRSDEDQKEADNSELKRRDELLKIREANRILAIDQRLRRKDLEREARNCNPTEEFYAQFNRSVK